MSTKPSKLYIVATPIGNLEDITLRALRILREVDLIVCEDTQTTRKLLEKYDIKRPTESYHAQSTQSKVDRIVDVLSHEKTIALVTDAGTPGISDPGTELVAEVRNRIGDQVEIIAIPGPSALTAALSISGLPIHDFVFLGFLPHKKGRKTLFEEISETERTVVFYESPHRILKTIESLKGAVPDRRVVIAREITKLFEEVISGTPAEIEQNFIDRPDSVRGEFVVIVSGR